MIPEPPEGINRFAFVAGVRVRSRDLQLGAIPLVDATFGENIVSVALREFAAGTIAIVEP